MDQPPKSFSFPLAFARTAHAPQDDLLVAAGDIGGTKTNLAIYRATASGMQLVRRQSFPSRQYPTFEQIILEFLSAADEKTVDRICLGIAGPVMNNRVQTTNLAWKLDSQDIGKETGISRVLLINDLEATSYGLAGLGPADLRQIAPGNSSLPGNGAVIAPGTGLGEAGLFWDGSKYHPFATEGGHSEFFPRSELDLELYGWLAGQFGIVSWERLISGPGLTNIYRFLKEVRKMPEPDWLAALVQGEDAGAPISECGLQNQAEICTEALRLFVRFLAHESTSLVLKYKATGGLFLAGGIPPKLISLLTDPQLFYKEFLQSDRMGDLVESVPVHVVMNPACALLGAAYFGAYGMN